MMQSCSHCYIAEIFDCFVDGKKLSIVMKFYNDGDLDMFIASRKEAKQPLSEEEVLTYFLQICLALRVVHRNNIVHRDIKPSNVFINRSNSVSTCLLGDFGVGTMFGTDSNLT